MKCNSCYADNAVWVSVCVMCGEPVVPVELCPAGHILPPGSRECAWCPSMWPAVDSFTGPAVLRGVLLVERGRIVDGPGSHLAFLEVRDRELPLTFSHPAPGRLTPAGDDARDAMVKLLMRPDGVRVCKKIDWRGGKLAYEPMNPDQVIQLGGVHLRYIPFSVPPGTGGDPVRDTKTGRRK